MSFDESIAVKNKKYPYKNLVLEGGGVLGIAYCGALEALHKRGFLAGIQNFAGASVGSIVACALATGSSFNFILQELHKSNFADFLDYGNKLYAIYNFYYKLGFCPGTAFENWYADIMEKLTGNRDITLKQAHEKYGGRLVVAATSLNRRVVKYFDYRTDPDLTLHKLVRMSASLPPIFEPVEHDGDLWVDGGVLDNYPIRAFHKNGKDSDRINPKTLGLMLMTATEAAAVYPKVTGIPTWMDALVGCYMSQTQKMYLDPQDWDRTIKIPCGNVSSFNFHIDDATKEALLEAGRKAVNDHFGSRSLIQLSQNNYYFATEPIDTGYRAVDEASPTNTPAESPAGSLDAATSPVDIPKKENADHDKPFQSSPPIPIPSKLPPCRGRNWPR